MTSTRNVHVFYTNIGGGGGWVMKKLLSIPIVKQRSRTVVMHHPAKSKTLSTLSARHPIKHYPRNGGYPDSLERMCTVAPSIGSVE